jgi:hypothetical protein
VPGEHQERLTADFLIGAAIELAAASAWAWGRVPMIALGRRRRVNLGEKRRLLFFQRSHGIPGSIDDRGV